LAVNAWDEEKSQVKKYVKKNKLTQRVLLNGSSVLADYQQRGVPTVFWIDPKGKIFDMEIGFHSAKTLENRTRKLMKTSGP
jgi:hypothetical protein